MRRAARLPRRDRRRLLVALGAGLTLAAAGAAILAWSRSPALPPIDLSGSDPAVRRAVEEALDRTRESPRSAAAWGELAMVLLAHDFIPAARSSFARAVRFDPLEPRWPYLEALADLKGVPDATAAITCLARAAELPGAEPAPRLRLGEELLELGRFDEAALQFRRVLQSQPENARAELGLGRAARLKGDLPEALLHLERSARSAPQVRATHGLLAEIHFRLGEREPAERERALAAGLPESYRWPDPYQAEIDRRFTGTLSRIERASGLFQAGRRDEALGLLRKTVEEDPAGLLSRLMLGRLLLQSGEAAAAEVALREAVQRVPEAFEARHELAAAFEKQGKSAEAAASYREALKRKPDYAPAHYGLAQCLLRQGRRGEALAELEASVRYRPDGSSAQRELGSLLAEMGRYQEAKDRLESALRLNPADLEARRLLSSIASQSGKPAGER